MKEIIMQIQIFVAILAGIILPIQALINGRLAEGVGGIVMASMLSFTIAALLLAFSQLIIGKTFPSFDQITTVPLLYWIGGFLGAVYVTGAITSVNALGATTAMCLIISGQILGALVVDYFVVVSATKILINIPRFIGAFLVLTGAILVVSS